MDKKYLVRIIGTENYYAVYEPVATTKEKATRLTKSEADAMLNRNKIKNKGKLKLEVVEVLE